MPEKTTQHYVNKNIYELFEPGYNPRKISDIDFQALKQSLLNFGAVQPAVVNINKKRYNYIIGGHQRIRAAQEIGWQVYPCIEVDLDIDREKELNIRLNRGGEFDFNLLQESFKTEDLISYGFDPDSVDFEIPKISESGEQSVDDNDLQDIHYNSIEDKVKITITFFKSDKSEVLEILRNIKLEGFKYYE